VQARVRDVSFQTRSDKGAKMAVWGQNENGWMGSVLKFAYKVQEVSVRRMPLKQTRRIKPTFSDAVNRFVLKYPGSPFFVVRMMPDESNQSQEAL
jgi:hypothetical protein